MDKKLKTLLLDVENQSIQVLEIEDNLHEFYKALNCDCIDIVERSILRHDVGTRKTFDVMLDDEGLLKAAPIASGLDMDHRVAFVGNLMFFHHNDEGELTSIDEDDIFFLTRCIYPYTDPFTGKTRLIMTGFEY